MSPSACSTRNGATPARSRSSISSASSSASPSNGSTPVSSARAAPIRRAHVSGAGRHGLQPHHGRHHPGVRRRAAHQGPARSLQPHRLHSARPLQHLQDRPLGNRVRRRCHINWVMLDSDWEAEFCRVAESHPKVRAYAKNHNLGLEVPYRYGSETRKYLPDFIVLVDDGHGETTCCTSSSRSKATGARTRRRRNPRWTPTGCPA